MYLSRCNIHLHLHVTINLRPYTNGAPNGVLQEHTGKGESAYICLSGGSGILVQARMLQIHEKICTVEVGWLRDNLHYLPYVTSESSGLLLFYHTANHRSRRPMRVLAAQTIAYFHNYRLSRRI